MCVPTIEKKYNATGIVLGNFWGGGKGTYPSEKLTNYDSIEKLLEVAKKMLKKGSLDSGMGFESLIGAGLIIEEFNTLKYNNELFFNSYDTQTYIGDMSQDELEFLEEQINTV
jgi:hypothetical protein